MAAASAGAAAEMARKELSWEFEGRNAPEGSRRLRNGRQPARPNSFGNGAGTLPIVF